VPIRPVEEITIRLKSPMRVSQWCDRRLWLRRGRARDRMRRLRAAGAALREAKVRRDLQDV